MPNQIKMLIFILSTVVSFFIIFLLLLKLLEYKQYSSICNEKGEKLKGISIYSAILAMLPFGSSESVVRIAHENHKKYGNVHMTYLMWMNGVSINSPEIAKKILSDSTTFTKISLDVKVSEEFQHIFANKHVVGANGDDWKRQRKSMDNGIVLNYIFLKIISNKHFMTCQFIKLFVSKNQKKFLKL